MDLESLDRRTFQRAIEKEVERMNSLPIHISVVKSAKSALEQKLKYFAGLREVATPEEAGEIDAEMTRLSNHLTKIDAELAARADEDTVDPSTLPDKAPEAVTASREARVAECTALFAQVLDLLNKNGESKSALQSTWLEENPGISRTQLTDYLGGRIKGRVSAPKCTEIERAILASAAALGLKTSSRSD
jgi:hypothetical protein